MHLLSPKFTLRVCKPKKNPISPFLLTGTPHRLPRSIFSSATLKTAEALQSRKSKTRKSENQLHIPRGLFPHWVNFICFVSSQCFSNENYFPWLHLARFDGSNYELLTQITSFSSQNKFATTNTSCSTKR